MLVPLQAKNMVIYRIKCPKCFSKADVIMEEAGIKGTYREPTINFVAKRIQCFTCGFIRDVPKGKESDYELWYKTDLNGHSLWAVNEKQLDFLISWLSGAMNRRNLSLHDKAYAETLPKWLITNKNNALEKLRQLKSKG